MLLHQFGGVFTFACLYSLISVCTTTSHSQGFPSTAPIDTSPRVDLQCFLGILVNATNFSTGCISRRRPFDEHISYCRDFYAAVCSTCLEVLLRCLLQLYQLFCFKLSIISPCPNRFAQ